MCNSGWSLEAREAPSNSDRAYCSAAFTLVWLDFTLLYREIMFKNSGQAMSRFDYKFSSRAEVRSSEVT